MAKREYRPRDVEKLVWSWFDVLNRAASEGVVNKSEERRLRRNLGIILQAVRAWKSRFLSEEGYETLEDIVHESAELPPNPAPYVAAAFWTSPEFQDKIYALETNMYGPGMPPGTITFRPRK